MACARRHYGQARHPAWYHNLLAHPEGEVSVGGESRRFRAREAERDERERIWREGLAIYPAWSSYERRASNGRIAVFVLEAI